MTTRSLIAGLLMAISCSFTLPAAAAMGFNDRGPLWADVAPAGSYAPRPPVTPALNEFNRAGVRWPLVAPAGSYAPRPPVRAILRQFNRR